MGISLKHTTLLATLSGVLICSSSFAQTGGDYGNGDSPEVATVQMHKVTKEGTGASLGEVVVRNSEYGLIFEPSLHGLEPGLHGFHLHQNASCQPSSKDGEITPGGAAGGHYDPEDTQRHDTPWGAGHKGDLPALYVDQDGTATRPVLAPRLERDDLEGRALMVHAGGDNYSDEPKPLGGGGARVACGVIDGDD